MENIIFRPIGVIRSPYKTPAGTPIQPRGALGVPGRAVLLDEYREGLRDLDGFSHVCLLYHFHLAGPSRLQAVPFLDSEPRGVFATRAPVRPNALGLSVVRLREVRGNTLHLENVDVVDGTPLIDIKPYVPDFDHWEVDSVGWLTGRSSGSPGVSSDDRFQRRDKRRDKS